MRQVLQQLHQLQPIRSDFFTVRFFQSLYKNSSTSFSSYVVQLNSSAKIYDATGASATASAAADQIGFFYSTIFSVALQKLKHFIFQLRSSAKQLSKNLRCDRCFSNCISCSRSDRIFLQYDFFSRSTKTQALHFPAT